MTSSALSKRTWMFLDIHSRSFSVVIRFLPNTNHLKDSVCLFYLLLRALDSIEDDMDLKKFTSSCVLKKKLVADFHTLFLFQQTDQLSHFGNAKEQDLLKHLGSLHTEFKTILSTIDQNIIMEVVKEMGEGMSEYIHEGVQRLNLVEYNKYCHIVAGLVGKGLTCLFVSSGLEDSLLNTKDWNSLGVLLQKTNIIRDIYEDEPAGRLWWPTDVLGKDCDKVSVLDNLVEDALQHVLPVVDYLDTVRNPNVFKFCLVPQLVALRTLSLCYHNKDTFVRKVKISTFYKIWYMKFMTRSQYKSEVIRILLIFMKKARQCEHIQMQETVQRIVATINPSKKRM
jgi:farnesyl-diphosphate farnesyltransferase